MRPTVILRNQRVYRDSVRVVRDGNTVIVVADGVELGALDWSRDERPPIADLVYEVRR